MASRGRATENDLLRAIVDLPDSRGNSALYNLTYDDSDEPLSYQYELADNLDISPRDQQLETAIYDQTAEKRMIHMEGKQIYQQYQMQQQHEKSQQAPAKGVANNAEISNNPFAPLAAISTFDLGLSGARATQLRSYVSINAGEHLELGDLGLTSDDLPYRHMSMLGHGGSASVEMVQDVNTGSVYARKIIRNVYTRNMKEARSLLQNEVRIINRLSPHHHIVRVHATYIAKRELAIVITPVADGGDLASFLQNCRDGLYTENGDSKWKKDCLLRRSLGCLASGLAFMHQQFVRHKDIKPQNILIHKGSIMYTDFGLSYDFGDAGQSTTTGPVQGQTKRYCAPEVAAGGKRNSKSDIFSLGCVYLEILDGLYGGVSEDILAGPFHEKIKVLLGEGTSLWVCGDNERQPEMHPIPHLLHPDPSHRLSASGLVDKWVTLATGMQMNEMFFCARCSNIKKSD